MLKAFVVHGTIQNRDRDVLMALFDTRKRRQDILPKPRAASISTRSKVVLSGAGVIKGSDNIPNLHLLVLSIAEGKNEKALLVSACRVHEPIRAETKNWDRLALHVTWTLDGRQTS